MASPRGTGVAAVSRFETKRVMLVRDGGRWTLQEEGHEYPYRRAVLEEISTARALEVAELLGVRDEAVQMLRREVEELKSSAASRLKRTGKERAEAEAKAVAERRDAKRIAADLALAEGRG